MVGFQGVASVLLIAGAVLFAQWQRQNPIPPAKFVEIRPGLHRLNYVLNLRVFAPAHVAVWLVESSPNSWILVDAGTPSLKHQRAILKGLQATLSSAEDTLRLVLGQTCCIPCQLDNQLSFSIQQVLFTAGGYHQCYLSLQGMS